MCAEPARQGPGGQVRPLRQGLPHWGQRCPDQRRGQAHQDKDPQEQPQPRVQRHFQVQGNVTVSREQLFNLERWNRSYLSTAYGFHIFLINC